MMPTSQVLESRVLFPQLPFHDLDNDELLKALGAWVYRSADKIPDKQDLFKDIIQSPDKNDPLKCLQDNYIESKYHTIKQTGKYFYDVTKQKGFSIMHCNTRSLGENEHQKNIFIGCVYRHPKGNLKKTTRAT